MGKLMDFLGGAAGYLANDLNAKREEERRREARKEEFAQQLDYVKASKMLTRKMDNEDRAAELNAQSPQIGLGDNGRQEIYRIKASVDPATSALQTTRERVGDAPVMPEGRPFTVYDGPNKRTVQRFSDGSERDLGDPSPVRAPSGGKSGGKRRTTLRNIDGRVKMVDQDTGEVIQDLGAAGAADPEKTAADIRKRYNADQKAIAEADRRTLKMMLKNVAGDVPASVYQMDDAGLRNFVAKSYDDHYSQMMEPTKDVPKTSKNQSKTSKEDRPKEENPPIPGAKKADDGFWYVQKGGKWFKVD